MEIRTAKMASGVLRGPRRGKREETGPGARLSCVYILRGSESGHVPILPCLPPPTHSLFPSFPPSFALLASATPCVSGQISPTVGSAGLCGGLFILERGLPSGSLHLSKHPPGRCSVFPASHSLPASPSPPPPPVSSPPSSLCSLSHPLSALSLLHHGSSRHPYSLFIFPFLSLISCESSFSFLLPSFSSCFFFHCCFFS